MATKQRSNLDELADGLPVEQLTKVRSVCVGFADGSVTGRGTGRGARAIRRPSRPVARRVWSGAVEVPPGARPG
jgi:hypothetical protein